MIVSETTEAGMDVGAEPLIRYGRNHVLGGIATAIHGTPEGRRVAVSVPGDGAEMIIEWSGYGRSSSGTIGLNY